MTFAEYIGRFHPLLVHLPIGILLFGFALMLYQKFRKVDLTEAISLAWLAGAIAALLSCGAGWLLAQSGDYETEAVQVHQWTGLATAALSFLTYAFVKYRWMLASATVILLTIAGHYGGNLTHGEGYLSFDNSPKEQSDTTATAFVPTVVQRDSLGTEPQLRRTFFYRDQVVPILEKNCYSCHSAKKKKGGLRLDTEAFIKKGGKNGGVLVAGNPQKSKLFSYLLLPHDDEMHMPPKGKRQLTSQEVAILHHWIAKGASFKEEVEVVQNQDLSQVEASAILPMTLPTLVADSADFLQKDKPALASVETSILAKPTDAPNASTVAYFQQQQVTLTPVQQGMGYVSANFVNVKAYQPSMLKELNRVQGQLVRLRLSNQPVRDEELKPLSALTNLNRLNLENTQITDAALAELKQLPKLEQLNLYGTAVTDEGIQQLATYPQLKVVYLWKTKVTPQGIERLKRAKPTLKIEDGQQRFTLPDTNKTTKTQS